MGSFQSGERYAQLEKEYRKTIAGLEREIRRLKVELAAAHAQTADVRNKWFQVSEDVEKEKEKELVRKDRPSTGRPRQGIPTMKGKGGSRIGS